MKTPEEWLESFKDHPDSKRPTLDLMSWEFLKNLVEDIQRDALNSPFANTKDQEELELAHDVNENLSFQVEMLTDSVEYFKGRWHEARRYLRQANRGAERNNQVMRLQSYDIERLLERIKQLEQTNQ
jgi:hypothetical protein